MIAVKCHKLMVEDLLSSGLMRQVANQPQPAPTHEAEVGRTYIIHPSSNFAVGESRLWGCASVLHFFTGSEDGRQLRRINPDAGRFLDNDTWRGAYGAIAMPQVRKCVELLLADPDTRRAVVSMGDCLTQDINRPACWSFIHFIRQRERLEMLVYQRSLNIRLMFYDCAVLTNLMQAVAHSAEMVLGSMRWTIGSLHCPAGRVPESGLKSTVLWYPPIYLMDPTWCQRELEELCGRDVD